jgi:hypothetical protein
MPTESELEQFITFFVRHGVEFLVIGEQAETLMGSPRVTYDTEPIGSYEAMLPASESFSVGELEIRTIGLEDLLMLDWRSYAGRPAGGRIDRFDCNSAVKFSSLQ